ncbi:SAM-dependent methyltransferase (plasmid) [Rhizobium sp. CB3171]|uniref:SAM-dependent methyltransferase n=1 Tax=Rhizobium sp. CB3171 TaxID=3039157 RepID=UPI0024B084C4|nr:SAM-dependent methyltransferase [Rhizobium sp. CB3171]WFU07245.1 SAM-dependent methyltransferase [Rhizobium sp. CB3171]
MTDATSTTSAFLSMKHGGYYSKAAAGAQDVILGAFDLIEMAVSQSIEKSTTSSFRCADYGCADGGTSLEMWRRVFLLMSSRKPSANIELFYDDLPNNDFNQLFKTIHKLTDFKSYLEDYPNVLTFASANSFHQCVLPPQSLDFGFSALATHYLSAPPCEIEKHIHMVGSNDQELAKFKEQGRSDWQKFLYSRSLELKSGGTLCVMNPGIDEAGNYLGNTGGVHIFNTFNELWTAFAKEGIITEAEYKNTNFSQHYRTISECTIPVTDKDNIVYKSGLRLEHAETRIVKCPKAKSLSEHQDSFRFANEYVPSLRSWIEPTLLRGLSLQRTNVETSRIMDDLFQSFHDSVVKFPLGHGLDYVHIYMICRKL